MSGWTNGTWECACRFTTTDLVEAKKHRQQCRIVIGLYLSLRNFLYNTTPQEKLREIQISEERGDFLRAELIKELR
jgi:hypothetical protein